MSHPCSNGLTIGIDLGTSNSCCYFVKDDGVECLLSNGKRLIPSFVNYRNNGDKQVGIAAKNQQFSKDSNVVRNSKRILARPFDCDEVQSMLLRCGVAVANSDGKPVFAFGNPVVNKTPGDIATDIVSYIISVAREMTECKVTDICITIPAHFDNNQRITTKQAVIRCGFSEDHIKLLNEPTAAAIAYGLQNMIENSRFLVYDLGGGTFDVSILNIVGDDIKVETYKGNNALGGADFDQLILDWILEEFRKQFKQELIPDKLPNHVKERHRNRLLSIAEEAKNSLSSIEASEICIPLVQSVKNCMEGIDDEDEYCVTLTLSKLNELIKKEIDSTILTVSQALKSIDLTEDDIDHVVLVGGSSRLICVRDALTKKFGISKLREAINPDECVAKGACLSICKNISFEDRIAYSLSKSIVGNRVMCVIPRNSIIPATFCAKTFTSGDDMTEVNSMVYQAEQDKNEECIPFNADSCIKLVPYHFTGFTKAKAGEVEFKTTFCYQKSGLVYITVEEVKTKKTLLTQQFEYIES